MTTLVQSRGLHAGYGETLAIRDVNLEVRSGEVVVLLGANGAGKTTTLLSLAGELTPTTGTVSWLGSEAAHSLHKRARGGLALVTEQRAVFSRLTTRQNLAIGRGCDVDKAFDLFPELGPLADRRGGLLSGGEQQMVTLGRALASPTKLLLADELSLGLAPQIVGRLLRAVRTAADQGMGALLVEQHVRRALEVADRVYVLHRGRIELDIPAADAVGRIDEIQDYYLSAAASGSQADQMKRIEDL